MVWDVTHLGVLAVAVAAGVFGAAAAAAGFGAAAFLACAFQIFEFYRHIFPLWAQSHFILTLAIITTRKSFGLILQLSIFSSSLSTFPEWISFMPAAGSSDLVFS